MDARYFVHTDEYPLRASHPHEVRDGKLTVIMDEYATREEAEQVAAALNAPPKAFHWRNGIYFRRAPDAAVEIVRVGNDTESAELIARIPENEWASIVCSVSAEGETGERWNAAQDFHGRQK